MFDQLEENGDSSLTIQLALQIFRSGAPALCLSVKMQDEKRKLVAVV